MAVPPIIDTPVFAQTYDAVATTFYSRTLPVNSFVNLYVQVVAVRPSNGDSKTWFFTVKVGRRSAGAILVNSTNIFTPIADAGASAWVAAVVVSGNDALLQFTGQASATISWQAHVYAMVITENI